MPLVTETQDTDATVKRIGEAVRAFCFRYRDERQLQAHLAQAFEQFGLQATREVIIDPRNRIDFAIGRIGVEVKVDGTLADIRRQLSRYAQTGQFDALVLITNRVGHTRLPPALGDVPLFAFATHAGAL